MTTTTTATATATATTSARKLVIRRGECVAVIKPTGETVPFTTTRDVDVSDARTFGRTLRMYLPETPLLYVDVGGFRMVFDARRVEADAAPEVTATAEDTFTARYFRSAARMNAAPASAEATPATPAPEFPRGLEDEACTRCGGSGRYSYCTMYGDTCFRCAGRRRTLTARGAAAALHLEALRSKPAGEVVAGDKIRVTLGTRLTTVVVQAVRAEGGTLRIECDRYTLGGVNPTQPVRVAQTAEGLRATRAAALDYQDTLDASGKARAAARPARRPAAR